MSTFDPNVVQEFEDQIKEGMSYKTIEAVRIAATQALLKKDITSVSSSIIERIQLLDVAIRKVVKESLEEKKNTEELKTILFMLEKLDDQIPASVHTE